jgi:hypothetical protein
VAPAKVDKFLKCLQYSLRLVAQQALLSSKAREITTIQIRFLFSQVPFIEGLFMAIVAIIGFIIIFILVIAFFSAATLINFALSFLVFHFIQKHVNGFIALTIAIVFSIALSFNVKIPEMIQDRNIANTIVDIRAPIKYRAGEKISISGNSSVSFRHTLYSITELGVGGTCSCLFRKDPTIITESILDSVLSVGLEVTSKEKARYHLGVYSTSKGNYDIVDMKLFDGENLVFNKQLLARRYYRGESYMQDKYTDFKMGFILNYLFDNTIWQHFFDEGYSPKQESLIEHELLKIFGDRFISAKEERSAAELIELHRNNLAGVEAPEFKEKYGCSSRVAFGSGKRISYVTIDDTTRRTRNSLDDHFYFCDEKTVIFFKAPDPYDDYFLLEEFDYDGKHLASRHYDIKEENWPRASNKKLIKFEIDKDFLLVGLDMVKDKFTDNQYIFKLRRSDYVKP